MVQTAAAPSPAAVKNNGVRKNRGRVFLICDNDVERFTNLETGQAATVDASLAMDLITQAAFRSTPTIRQVLDTGCGPGNNTITLLQCVSPFACDLVDLSLPMLERAWERIFQVNTVTIRFFQGDFRDIDLPDQSYNVILTAAVLHHLGDDADWKTAFVTIFRLAGPGSSVWTNALVSHDTESVQTLT